MHNHFPPGLHVAEKLGMSVGFCTNALNLQNFLTIFLQKHLFPPRRLHYRLSNSSQNCHNHKHFSCRVDQNGGGAAAAAATLSENTSLSASSTSPISDSGLNDDLMGYMLGKKKATEVAHSVWKHFVRKGDTVVDATCGNGLDTLAMLKMVKDDLVGGTVYGMDIQEDAVKRTSSLLDSSLNPTERKSVKLFTCCHSRMLEVLPKYSSVRLVAFNLGFLPGGDKSVVTKPYTTRLALEAAKEVLVGGGLISLVVYVGHPGGREEFDSVHGFACGLPSDDWCCSQIQVLNRPLAPILVFLFKR